MNALQKLISQQLKCLNLTEEQLIDYLGFDEFDKGKVELDYFQERVVYNGKLKQKLAKALKIDTDTFNKVIEQTYESLEQQAKIYKKSISVKLSGRPSPLLAGSCASKVIMPQIPENCSVEEEIKLVINQYKQTQMERFADSTYMIEANGDFDKFVELVEVVVNAGGEVSWAIGNGFTFYRAENELYKFNRYCRQML